MGKVLVKNLLCNAPLDIELADKSLLHLGARQEVAVDEAKLDSEDVKRFTGSKLRITRVEAAKKKDSGAKVDVAGEKV